MLRLLTILGIIASVLGFPADDRVIGGSDAESNTYVWQVSLQEPYESSASGYWHFCGGSLITSSYVLTAAHCYMEPDIVTVYVGSTQKFSGGTRHTVASFIQHPNYNSARISMDYGIIHLSEPVDTSNSAIGLIAVPSLQDDTMEYSGSGIVTGWGYYQYGPGVVDRLPDDLQVGYLDIKSDTECKDAWRFNYQSDCMVCAGGDGTSSICMGDSGGPFTTIIDGTTTLIGAVSWVESNCDPTYPSVFAKVSSVIDWVHANTENLEGMA